MFAKVYRFSGTSNYTIKKLGRGRGGARRSKSRPDVSMTASSNEIWSDLITCTILTPFLSIKTIRNTAKKGNLSRCNVWVSIVPFVVVFFPQNSYVYMTRIN